MKTGKASKEFLNISEALVKLAQFIEVDQMN